MTDQEQTVLGHISTKVDGLDSKFDAFLEKNAEYKLEIERRITEIEAAGRTTRWILGIGIAVGAVIIPIIVDVLRSAS